jgi:uncharacterized protein
MNQLTGTEPRVLGVLIEKQATTPDVYPMTLNAIVVACNQKTSREPVMALHPGEVRGTLNDLSLKDLVRAVPGARAERWEHRADKTLDLVPSQRILLALLMLRGPQTLSELHVRSDRMHDFPDAGAVQQALDRLADKGFVKPLERRSGQRETRYAHLLSGEPAAPSDRPSPDRPPPPPDLDARLRALEERVAELERRMESGA